MAESSIYCLFIFKVLCRTLNSSFFFFFKSYLLKWLKTIHQGGGAVSTNLCLCWKWNSWAASSLLVLTQEWELDMVLSPCFLVFNSKRLLASFLVISARYLILYFPFLLCWLPEDNLSFSISSLEVPLFLACHLCTCCPLLHFLGSCFRSSNEFNLILQNRQKLEDWPRRVNSEPTLPTLTILFQSLF